MFDNIIGNNSTKNTLKNIIDKNNISHSYIFSGIEGIGKMLFAMEFAKAILCNSSNNKPCNHCDSCKTFETSNNPDIILIDEHENTIKTEMIKELTFNILKKPIQSDKKIYIINNSENMTISAQNSLLKTLEEPPEFIVIILITCNETLLLNTIKSRCIKISFNNLLDKDIKEYFNKNLNDDDDIINASGGSIGKAIKFNERKENFIKIKDIIQDIENMNELQILNLKHIILNNKEDIFEILDYINIIFYNEILRSNKIRILKDCMEIIEETKQRLRKNCNYDMTIDKCLLEIERRFNNG